MKWCIFSRRGERRAGHAGEGYFTFLNKEYILKFKSCWQISSYYFRSTCILEWVWRLQDSWERVSLLGTRDDTSWLDPELGHDEFKIFFTCFTNNWRESATQKSNRMLCNKDHFSILYQHCSRLLSLLKMMNPGLFCLSHSLSPFLR